MITQENLPQLLETLEFSSSSKNSDISPKIYTKTYNNGAQIIGTLQEKKISYPEAIQKGDETTCNFSHNENFVVLECVNRLLEKGYPPENLELEPRWRLGRESKTSGKADIVVKDNTGKIYIIIECKTAGAKFNEEWENMRQDGGQLLSYFCQDKNAQFLCLYTSDYSSDVDKKLTYRNIIISTKDNEDFLREKNLKGYNNAKAESEIFQVWRDVYEFAAEKKEFLSLNLTPITQAKLPLILTILKKLPKKTRAAKAEKMANITNLPKYSANTTLAVKKTPSINLLISFCAKFMTKRITKIISIFVIAALWRIALKAYKIAS